ncbi:MULTISPECIES: helix-turn-helix domain-containing protein [Blautia]|uniref:helix-turn-helix domain-containing protein n=1 Tax=Blautia TaxID=572511 RepID=UPI000BA36108|nr:MULTISPECIES: helix-turn-helix domain-containing protein [Blautia]
MDENYIGNRIKQCRLEKKMTQKQLGKIMGISETLISQYERGKRNPKVDQLRKIADALNIPYNYLVTEPDKENLHQRKGPIEILDVDRLTVSGGNDDKTTRLYSETLKFLLKILQLKSGHIDSISTNKREDYTSLINSFSEEELKEIVAFVKSISTEEL